MLALSTLLAATILSIVSAICVNRWLLWRLNNHALRIATALSAFVVSWVALAWVGLWLASDPPSIYKISSTYYLSQSPGYGMARTADYYHLTFYQTRSWWFDKKIGTITMSCSCMGDERLTATIEDVSSAISLNRLLVQAAGQSVVDTTLSFNTQFDFHVNARIY